MGFLRRKSIRKEFDEKLIQQLETLKRNWFNQKSLLERSVDPSEEAIISSKIAEVKYFYLFKEAKRRKVMIKR